MKKILLTLLIFFTCNIPAFCLVNYPYEEDNDNDVKMSYYQRQALLKYFNTQAETIRKHWKKNTKTFKPAYDKSYIEVRLIVTYGGKILSYKIIGSRLSDSDNDFINKVKQTIDSIKLFDMLPEDIGYISIPLNVKFYAKLPQYLPDSENNNQKYGIANIELDKQNTNVFLKK